MKLKTTIHKNAFFSLLIFVVLTCIGCQTTKSYERSNLEYNKTVLAVETDFQATSNIITDDNHNLIFGGYIADEGYDYPAIITLEVNEQSLTYEMLDSVGIPIYITKINDGYAYITKRHIDSPIDEMILSIYMLEKPTISVPLLTLCPYLAGYYETVFLAADNENIFIIIGNKCIQMDLSGCILAEYTISGITIDTCVIDDILYIFKKSGDQFSIETIDPKDMLKSNIEQYDDDFRLIYGKSFTAYKDTLLYIQNETGLIEYDLATKEYASVVTWSDVGIYSQNISDIVVLSADEFIVYGQDVTNNKLVFSHLEQGEVSNVEERILVRVSYMEDGSTNIPLAVIKYNNMQSKYYVIAEEYRTISNEGSYSEQLSAYDADIISGEIGDVLVMSSSTDYKKYSDKGALCNLYQIIDDDDTFSSDMIFDCIRHTLEENGNLFVIIPEFQISTLVGKEQHFSNVEWNTTNMLSILNKQEDNNKQLLDTWSRERAYNILISSGLTEFINYDQGTCFFDNEQFIDLIEYISSLPTTNTRVIQNDASSYINDDILLYEITHFGGFVDYLILRSRFGFNEEIENVGYPSAEGGATKIIPSKYLGISSNSKQKEGAWDFIKFLLSGNSIINETKGMQKIPALKKTFQEWAKSEKRIQYYFKNQSTNYRVITETTDTTKLSNGKLIQLNDQIITSFYEFINGISLNTDIPQEIYNIVEEELELRFNGVKDSKTTAEIIQRRVSIYLSEQYN